MTESTADKLAADASPSSSRDSGFSSGVVGVPLPRVFGRLLLLKLLARGGMGDVYLAATTGIEGAERPIVVKTVRRDHIHDGSFLARFLDEARVQSQLNHPGVAHILEASTDENGEPYTVVEYVEGRSLADVRHRAVQVGAKIGWAEAAALVVEMGQALAHVHERSGADGSPLGIVHRDLSPQNVMIGYAGEVKLIDFGTARGHNRRCHTVAGVVFAKPGYVAPEVARQQVGDGRIDVYAIGVMLWELCAGRRLLTGDAQKHLEEVAASRFDIPALAGTRGIPRELDVIIAKLCANDPDERYANAAQAATDLARVLAQAPAGKNGERSVRARIASLMKALWSQEPARSRSEFAKLLKQARELRHETQTPPASATMEIAVASMTQDPSILPGTPYRLVKKIGEGASGEVFEGEHVELGRRYAVKVLSAAHTAAHDAVERFRREARAIASISHPNLVRLHDFGKSVDGRVFLVMELLQGKTLDAHAQEALSWTEATELAVQAARALEAAHAAGLVHRDLKPQNLFLTDDGTLKLLDFGVAMALAETAGDEKRQKGFAVFGTPEYMAPEQVAGESVDARCDVYALGCVLYQLLTGSVPFDGTPVVVMGKQLREAPERPSVRASKAIIPAELEAVVLRALAKKKEDRFFDAREMREELEDALIVPARRRKRSRRIAGIVAAMTMMVGVAAGFEAGHIRAYAMRFMPTRHASVAQVDVPPVTTTSAADLPSAAEPPMPRAEAPGESPAAEAPPSEPTPRAPDLRAASEPPKESSTKDVHPVRSEHGKDEHTDARTSLLVRASLREEPASHGDARLDVARRAAKDDHSVASLKNWATSALRAGELREARRAAEAWAVEESGAEPRIFLATVLDMSGKKRDARLVLQEWLTTHPESPDARRALNRLGSNPEPAIKHHKARHPTTSSTTE